VRTVSGRGFIKVQEHDDSVTEALAGFPVAIDPTPASTRSLVSLDELAFLSLDGPRPVVDVEARLRCPELTEPRDKPATQPALETHLTPYVPECYLAPVSTPKTWVTPPPPIGPSFEAAPMSPHRRGAGKPGTPASIQ